jgi:superfamily II DNA or RNA helicase
LILVPFGGVVYRNRTVATYHSLKGPRLERYDPEDFVGVIVDEAHHAAAPS